MRKKLCTVSVNGEEFYARRGELLLDAALTRGVDLAHDCRSGRCGTCRVRVVDGRLIGGDCGEPGVALACQGRIIGDLAIEVEAMPEVLRTAARVSRLRRLTSDVVEVAIEPARPIVYLPGQYFQVRFRGFPARCFSPTVPLEGRDDRTIRLHIRRVPNGRVSSALGTQIRPDHRLKLDGPFGSAYLRAELPHRIVLVASGTGFAPIWSIATAAAEQDPKREMVIVVGARSLADLYMVPALCWLARLPNVTVIPVTDLPQSVTPAVRTGRPTDHVPPLSEHDVVYACGAPPMVAAVARMAAAAGARCYADPFESPRDRKDGLLSRAFGRLDPTRPGRISPSRMVGGPMVSAAVPAAYRGQITGR